MSETKQEARCKCGHVEGDHIDQQEADKFPKSGRYCCCVSCPCDTFEPVAESQPQQDACGICNGETVVDSGGVQPWGEAIFVKCGHCNGTGKEPQQVAIPDDLWRIGGEVHHPGVCECDLWPGDGSDPECKIQPPLEPMRNWFERIARRAVRAEAALMQANLEIERFKGVVE